MAFQLFRDYGKSMLPKVTITKYGSICLNQGAKSKFRTGDYQFCRLYFDPDTRRIGIELTNDSSLEAVRALRQTRHGTEVSARSFLNAWEIDYSVTQIYDVQKDRETGFLVIDLSTGRPRRSRKSSNGKGAKVSQ